MTKFIFVTGGVVSGLGKGITTASLGRLLKSRGLRVTAQKIDPYINVEPGIMNPYQHGEIFITDDGASTDLDIGHYERFMNENLGGFSSLTAGKVYLSVFDKERNGLYHGETVQVIPHITNEIKAFIYSSANRQEADVVLTEIGGTVGDMESQPFLEAIRQISVEAGKNNCLFIHVTLVPYLHSSGEQKSKPTQHSVRLLQSAGIQPDIIVARCDAPLNNEIIAKISSFCNVKNDCVIENINVSDIYFAPLMLEKKGFSDKVCRELCLNAQPPELSAWQKMCKRITELDRYIKIAIVGEYIQLHDAYLTVTEALKHAGYKNNIGIDIEWVSSDEAVSENISDLLCGCAGVLISDSSINKDINGRVEVARFCRENNVPVLAVGFGMIATVAEFVHNILGQKNADLFGTDFQQDSLAFSQVKRAIEPSSQAFVSGAYPCRIKHGTLLFKAYDNEIIYERHRHRYFVDSCYSELLEQNGITVSALSSEGNVIEAVEYSKCDFCVGTLFLPEMKSRPNHASPLYNEFISASLRNAENNKLFYSTASL